MHSSLSESIEDTQFYIKLLKSDNMKFTYRIDIKQDQFENGVIPYKTLIPLLKEEIGGPKIKFIKIRYLEENTKCFFSIKQGFALDPSKFNEHFVVIMVEIDPLGNEPIRQELSKERDTRISRNEILEERINTMEMNFGKVKILLSGIIKYSRIASPEIMEIVSEIYTPGEIEQLELNELLNPSLVDRFPEFPVLKETLSLNREISLIREQSSMSVVKSKKSVSQKEVLHFGILYSNPLVHIVHTNKNTLKTAQLTSDPVDFAGECKDILKSLQAQKKLLNIDIECASADQLSSVLMSHPRLLHVICHGEYAPSLNEYYLEFENSRAELFMLTTSRLEEMLKFQDLSETKLVFINACHSENVARVFLKYNVNCIIVIESMHKIEDSYARVFSNYFYTQLIEGKTINQAFQNAITQLRMVNIDSPESCCCSHPHKPECGWKQYAKENGMFAAHQVHISYCDCPQANKHIHSSDCDWADTFSFEFDAQYAILNDKDDSDIRVCCCSPELTHDETMKLRLIYRDDNREYGDIVVFDDLVHGKVRQKNPHSFVGTTFKDCITIGQNLLLYNMYNAFVHETCRVIYLVGESGSGKSTISKHLANYLLERHKVSDVSYINMDRASSINMFSAKIPGFTRNAFRNKNFEKNFSGEGTLLILDHMDAILKHHYKAFNEKLVQLLQESTFKFIITTNSKADIREVTVSRLEKFISIPSINPQSVAKLIISMAKDSLPLQYRNLMTLKKHEICNKKGLTPTKISDIAFMINKGYELDRILTFLDNQPVEGNVKNTFSEDNFALKEKKKFLSYVF